MNKLINKIALIIFFIFSFSHVFSQTETDTLKQVPTVIVKMNNGDEYKGQILHKDNKTILLKTVNGEINLIASNVSSIETDTLKQGSTVIVKMNNGDEYKGQILHKDNKTILLKTVNGEINLIASNVSSIETDTFKQGSTVIVKMNNGDEYKGQILHKDNKTIVLKIVNGELNLTTSKVSSIESYDYDGEFEFPNSHDTRYFFGPSGIPIKKGKGYYQNVLVVANFVNYGIANNISIGGGLEFFSTVVAGNPIWFLTPKVGFDISENVHVGGGFIMAGLAGEGTATLGYGVFTLGHAETNLSVGVGYGFVDGELSDYPAIMISGTHRISNSIALLSENYWLDTSSFGIHGIRILSKTNSFDIGVIVIPDEYTPTLPYVGYAKAF